MVEMTCMGFIDEDENGEILCGEPAPNICRECHGWYCDKCFNHLMSLCDADSEVEAAKYI